MSDHANIPYAGVADRLARTAFERVQAVCNELYASVEALKRKSADGAGAAGYSDVAASVSAVEIREASGVVVLAFAFEATLSGTPGYDTLLKVTKAFPKAKVAGAVGFLSAPPAAGAVSCVMLEDGSVKVGTVGTGGAYNCVGTLTWIRR